MGALKLFLDHGKQNILGVIVCLALFCSGFIINGGMGLYLNLSGLVIVIGGAFGATLMSYRVERVIIMFKVVKASYGKAAISPDVIVKVLMELSVKRRIRGLLALEDDEREISIVFLRQAIGFIVDDYSMEQIREALNAEMYFFRMRREETCRVLQTMVEVTPAFGLVGSVVGLIGMLYGIGDSAIILSTIPIALTSTLYGLVLTNFFFLPFVANIKERTVQEIFLQKIITEGVIAIAGNMHPRMLERKLNSFLTPSARKGDMLSLVGIKEKLELKKSEEEAENKIQIEPIPKGETIA